MLEGARNVFKCYTQTSVEIENQKKINQKNVC